MRQPAVGIQRTGEPVHADAAAFEIEFLDALGDAVGPSPFARPDIADPILRALPAGDKVGICTMQVGSPSRGNTSTLNSALPPTGQR